MLFNKAAIVAVFAALTQQVTASHSGFHHRRAHPAYPAASATVADIPILTPTPTPEPPPPAPGTPFDGKRGLAYNDGNLANTFGGACPSCAWGYNWGSSRNDLDELYSFVPMLWGDAPEWTDSWDANAEDALNTGSVALLSFNEPDNTGQANMTPEQAASSHAAWMNKYQGRALIGAPAITNSGDPGQGLEWLQGFMDACNAQEDGCAVDFCPVHWYSEAQYQDTLFTHLESAHDICDGKPIWLTEFAPVNSDSELVSFVEDVIPQLEALDYLHAYSYFMVEVGRLMFTDIDLSDYGQAYADL